MKKRKIIYLISIIICIAIVVSASFYIGYKTAYNRIENSEKFGRRQTFYATVSDVSSTETVKGMRVKGIDANDINFRGEFTFLVEKETKIVWRNTYITFEDLDVGDMVSITFYGEILETYPAQISHVEQIQLLDDTI